MNSACAVWRKEGDKTIPKHKYSVQEMTSTEVDQSQRAAVTKIRTEGVSETIQNLVLYQAWCLFPGSSNNKCCSWAACPLLGSSLDSWLPATEEWWTWEELASPLTQYSNFTILSCLPCWHSWAAWIFVVGNSSSVFPHYPQYICTFHSNAPTFRVILLLPKTQRLSSSWKCLFYTHI